MIKFRNINVFWWSSVKLDGEKQENFGDILSKYLVEKISGKRVVWRKPSKQNQHIFRKKIYTTTGSILKHISKDCVVWGSGIISKTDKVERATFLAVRGPESYEHLVSKGYVVNKVYGDPAIVLKQLYKPKTTKQFDIGVIPHYVDYKKVSSWYENNKEIKVIDLLNDDVEAVIEEITSCKQIVSSSLHGVIVSHTYDIPSIWVQFSKKLSGDNIKFVDYFRSVNLQPYTAEFIERKRSSAELQQLLDKYPNIPLESDIKDMINKLMNVCPFKKQ